MNHWLKRTLAAALAVTLVAVSGVLPLPFAKLAAHTVEARAHGSENPASSSAALRLIVDRSASNGELSSVLADQLRYRLSVIDLLAQQQAYTQAKTYLDDMLTYVSDPSVLQQNLISAEVVSALVTEAAGFTQALSSGGGPLTLVDNGTANAVIIVPPAPNVEATEAAELLADYVQRSTGAVLPILTEQQADAAQPPLNEAVRLHVGAPPSAGDAYVEHALQDLDRDGFVIHAHGDAVTIAGPSRWGTLNGVSAFLETVVGVRWLFPGPDGEDVPERTTLTVPYAQIREEPAFTQRVISPLSGNPYDGTRPPISLHYYDWAQRNRLQGNYNRPIEFHHNMYSLFSVAQFGTSHPEFYPNGRPPAAGVTAGWQPCFSEPGTVDAAVYRIIQFFQNNPDRTSYSLGVNDSRGFCEANPSHPAYPNAINSLGLADLSELYYDWVNQVVSQVAAVYPDKWFGLIAYQNVNDPPSFPLHPQVVPFLTKDRMSWLDPAVQAAELARLQQWESVTAQLGWYDYTYGSVYAVPRIYPHLAADLLRQSQDYGTVAHYMEMYPSAIDGPKAWLSAKLLWDPAQDEDDLLEEWYERAVGSSAAPELAAFYDLWETIWTTRMPSTGWFELGKSKTFLPFSSGSYLNAVTEADIATARSRMEAVVALAGTSEQQTRAEKLMSAFELVEASVLSFPREVQPPATAAAALALLDELESTLEDRLSMADKREQLISSFQNDPMLALPSIPPAEASGWNKHELWELHDYAMNHEPGGGPVTDRIDLLAASATPSPVRDFARLLQSLLAGTPSLTDNASFETGTTNAAVWRQWIVSGGTMRRSVEQAYTGSASMKVTGLERGGPYQTFPVQPGLLASRVHYYVPTGSATQGTIQLAINVRGSTSTNLATIRSEQRPLADTAGQWASIGLLEQIPASINGVAVQQVQFIVTVDGLSLDESVYLDDAVILQP